jgi:hypothetical protein
VSNTRRRCCCVDDDAAAAADDDADNDAQFINTLVFRGAVDAIVGLRASLFMGYSHSCIPIGVSSLTSLAV